MALLTFTRMSVTNAARTARWHGPGWKQARDPWSTADWSNALAGEAGEAANIVKKIRRLECSFPDSCPAGDREELVTMLADELADVVLYADLLAQRVGIDLGTAVVEKFNRKSYEQGFPECL